MAYSRAFSGLTFLAIVAAAVVPDGASAWDLSSVQEASVRAGDIVVVAVRDGAADGRGAATIQAAVLIQAPAAKVFDAMTDCAAAPAWVPHLVRCAVLESDPGGRWEVIAHEVDYGWFAPRVRYTFRAHYTVPSSVRFEHVSGDFESNEGIWSLVPRDGGVATLVTYRVKSRPKMHVPTWLYERGVRAEIPRLLQSLRSRVEG